jgi:hypothetical protein
VVVGDAVTHTRKKREEGESKKEWMTAYQPNERQEEGYSRAEEKRRTPGESNKQTLAGKSGIRRPTVTILQRIKSDSLKKGVSTWIIAKQ